VTALARTLAASLLTLTLATAVAPTAATAAQAAPPPEKVSFRDGRTSDPSVDISRVSMEASWYWISEQYVRVAVPGGFRPGHRMTVWFDIDSDGVPDGHYELRLGGVRNEKQGYLVDHQQFRIGGGWTRGGTRARCSDGDGYAAPESSDVTRGQREISLALDLWGCLKATHPAGEGSGAWRVSVEVARGGEADRAPGRERWSPLVRGWGPCDPTSGEC
jgi:hypothetical protein